MKLSRPALQSLPEQIAERIYAAIVGGDYPPGERIREEELARGFGVSRGPVREALRLLERDSVVRVVANRGAHVTPLSAQELNDIFEIRRVLAGAGGRDGAPPGQRRSRIAGALWRTSPRARAGGRRSRPGGLCRPQRELSLTLAQASGNERLAEIMRSLARQSWRYTQLALKDTRRRRESVRNWRALFDALSRGQGEVAGQAMEKLVEDARIGAVRLLEAEGVFPPAGARRRIPAELHEAT